MATLQIVLTHTGKPGNNMKQKLVNIVLYFAVIFSVSPCFCDETKAVSARLLEVILYPEHYYDKTIIVEGFIRVSTDGATWLYFSKDAATHKSRDYGIPLDTTSVKNYFGNTNTEWHLIDEKQAHVTATFKKMKDLHNNSAGFTLTQIQQVKIWTCEEQYLRTVGKLSAPDK